MRGRKPIAQVVVHIGPKRKVQYKASDAAKIAGLANKQGLALITPEMVSVHANNGILSTVPSRKGRFFVSEQGVRDYFNWLSTRWHGANLIRSAITENRLFALAREGGIRLYKPIERMITDDITSGRIQSAGKIVVGHRAYKLFYAKAAYDYIENLKREIPLREKASLERTVQNAEKKIAMRKAREERVKKAHEMKMLMRKKKIEKKAIAEARRRAHEIKMLKKPEETKGMQRFEKRILAELKKKGLWTLRELAERTQGKRSPSHLFHDFENGAILGAYYSRYKTRSGKPLVVVPEGNALSYLKKVEAWKRKWVAREKKPKRKSAWKEKSPYINPHEPTDIKTLRMEQAKAIQRLREINSKLPLSMLENTDEANMPDNWKNAHAMVVELARKIREAGY